MNEHPCALLAAIRSRRNFVVMADHLRLLVVVMLAFAMLGCDIEHRTGRLEKQVEELKTEVGKIKAASDLELQAKCSRDAEVWFDKHWSQNDKDTVLLVQRNHYNKSLNKCFVFVQYHYRTTGGNDSWVNDMSLWNLYENVQLGTYTANHTHSRKPTYEVTDELITCVCEGQKCDSIENFNAMVNPYLDN
jgi:hypothetical protein